MKRCTAMVRAWKSNIAELGTVVAANRKGPQHAW